MAIEARACRMCGFMYRADFTICPSCRFVDNGVSPEMSISIGGEEEDDGTILIDDIPDNLTQRITTGRQWDEIFGWDDLDEEGTKGPAGAALDSVTLIGGMPGAGKSTLGLQLGAAWGRYAQLRAQANEEKPREVIYVVAEESDKQVRARYRRIKLIENKRVLRIYAMATAKRDLLTVLYRRRPAGVILDSLPGFVGKDLNAAVELCHNLKGVACEIQAPIFVIDHATKADDIAGLLALQHEVDTTVSMFKVNDVRGPDGEPRMRQLRVLKNRYGRETTVTLLMTPGGLVCATDFLQIEEIWKRKQLTAEEYDAIMLSLEEDEDNEADSDESEDD